MKTTKVSIDKLTLTIGEKELELTLEEAKKLHQALDRLLAVHFPVFPTPVVIERPYPVYQPYRWPWWDTTSGGLSCSSQGANGKLMSTSCSELAMMEK